MATYFDGVKQNLPLTKHPNASPLLGGKGNSAKFAMSIKLKKATKHIPKWISTAVRGGVYTLEVQPRTHCYFYVIDAAVGIYPVASCNLVLPIEFFSPKTWRWLLWPWMHFPQKSQFLGRLNVTDEDVKEPEYYEHFTNTVHGLLPEFRIRRNGQYERAQPKDCLGLAKYVRTTDLGADLLTLLPQMMVINELASQSIVPDVKSK